MAKILFFLFSSLFLIRLYAQEDETFLDREIDQLSYYIGYLIGQDHAKNSFDFPTNFEKLTEGIRSGIANKPSIEKEELVPLIKRYQRSIVEKQSQQNLEEAEKYLQDLASSTQELTELVPKKLFYKTQKEGKGPLISCQPKLHFTMSEWKNSEFCTLYSTDEDIKEPLLVELDAVIPGFSKGVEGMKVGGKRTLYIHPDLAFGAGKLNILPNRLIVIEVDACSP